MMDLSAQHGSLHWNVVCFKLWPDAKWRWMQHARESCSLIKRIGLLSVNDWLDHYSRTTKNPTTWLKKSSDIELPAVLNLSLCAWWMQDSVQHGFQPYYAPFHPSLDLVLIMAYFTLCPTTESLQPVSDSNHSFHPFPDFFVLTKEEVRLAGSWSSSKTLEKIKKLKKKKEKNRFVG